MKKDPVVQLEASKSSIKDLLGDLLNYTKGFKYQITVKVLLKKTTSMEKFNTLKVTKTGINHRFKLENSFQDILHLTDNRINEGSG